MTDTNSSSFGLLLGHMSSTNAHVAESYIGPDFDASFDTCSTPAIGNSISRMSPTGQVSHSHFSNTNPASSDVHCTCVVHVLLSAMDMTAGYMSWHSWVYCPQGWMGCTSTQAMLCTWGTCACSALSSWPQMPLCFAVHPKSATVFFTYPKLSLCLVNWEQNAIGWLGNRL